MKDDEKRKIGKQRVDLRHSEVYAYRVDSETPYVILKIGGEEIWLDDVEAHELMLRIGAALKILPTSK